MNNYERDKLWDLYDITNKLSGTPDLTAVSPIALSKYKEAYGKLSKIISLIITRENDEQCQQYINELDALSRWNFGDRWGRISTDEIKANDRIKEIMNGWTPMDD